jgi:hypothetical protein
MDVIDGRAVSVCADARISLTDMDVRQVFRSPHHSTPPLLRCAIYSTWALSLVPLYSSINRNLTRPIPSYLTHPHPHLSLVPLTSAPRKPLAPKSSNKRSD